jgi:hypothetical protein
MNVFDSDFKVHSSHPGTTDGLDALISIGVDGEKVGKHKSNLIEKIKKKEEKRKFNPKL